jgi:hypothetical protein
MALAGSKAPWALNGTASRWNAWTIGIILRAILIVANSPQLKLGLYTFLFAINMVCADNQINTIAWAADARTVRPYYFNCQNILKTRESLIFSSKTLVLRNILYIFAT